MEYDAKKSGIKFKWQPNFAKGKIMSLKGKQVIYKIKDLSGKSAVNKGKVDFIESKYKEVQKTKKYDFTKFVSGISDAKSATKKALKSKKENFAAVTAGNDNYDINREFDPVQTDNSDSKYLFDNENAIIVNFKNNKK